MSFRHVSTAAKARATRHHNGLPDGWNRDRFRQLCVAYAQAKNVSAQCIRTLEIAIDMIPPDRFKNPLEEPFCYAKQETLIGGRGLTDKTIHNHEKNLELIGLIERRLGANGSRCRRKGLGLYLTPAMNMIEEMLNTQEEQREQRRLHDELRGERSRLYRYTKAALEDLESRKSLASLAKPLAKEFASWPRSDKLKYMTIERLQKHIEEATYLWTETQALLLKPQDISGQPEDNFGCHIQDQNKDESLSCNAQSVNIRPSANASEPRSVCSDLARSSRYNEKNDRGPNHDHKLQMLPKITNWLFYELASEELRMHIDIARGGSPSPNPSWYEIETGTWSRLSELGTNISAWQQAIDDLTPIGAMVAGLITDARLSDPKQPAVVSPGGYFRGMIQANERGELNLLSSFMGLLARREKEERPTE